MFDAAAYRKQVLAPYKNARQSMLAAALRELKQDETRKLPSSLDLAELYAITPGMSDADVASRLAEIVDVFNKGMSNAVLKSVAPNLIELNKLLVGRNSDIATAAFWIRIGQARAEQDRAALGEFGAGVVELFRGLGVVNKGKLRQLAKAAGIPESIGDGELAEAVRKAGVQVAADFVPPSVAVPTAITSELRKTSYRSLVSAIFLDSEPSSFKIVDGFASEPPGQRLTLDLVRRSREETDKRGQSDENDAAQKILGALLGAARSDAELHTLVLAHFVEVGKQLAESPLQSLALKEFVGRGLDRTDAARILLLFSGGAREAGLPEVHAKIQEGALREARRIFDAQSAAAAGSETDALSKARAALESAEQKLAELRAKAKAAVESGNLQEAAEALRGALTICSDDESLAEMERALPPAAPLNVIAVATDDSRVARISWEPGFGTTSDSTYKVIRKVGSRPLNNTDGEVLASGLAATTYVDPKPPYATTLFYGVAASRGGGYSPVAAISTEVVPPVRGIQVSSDPSSVTLRWETPPGARAVTVQQVDPDGTTSQVPVGAHSSATSTRLRTGSVYTYILTAHYTGLDGKAKTSEPRKVEAIPRGIASPVSDFTLSDVTAAGGFPELEASWPPVDGFVVEIWHFPHNPEWTVGRRIPMSRVRAEGTQLAGRSIVGGPREGVRGAPGFGLRHYVAVTRDAGEGVIGRTTAHGIGPRIENATAERFGDEVLLAWDWPGSDFDVLVQWQAEGRAERRTITLSTYRGEGGCRVRLGSAGASFSISTVSPLGGVAWASPQSTVDIAPAAVPVAYRVDFRKRLVGPPVTAKLTFSAVREAGCFEVTVVGHADHVMPRDGQGTVLARVEIDLRAQASADLDVPLPRIRGPYWVRAFSSSPEWRLVDPPATQLKLKGN